MRALAASRTTWFLVGAISIGIAWGVSGVLSAKPHTTGLRESSIDTASSTYQFIDPLIAVKDTGDSPLYDNLRARVSSYLDSQKSNGLMVATVYFRDMNESSGFVVHPEEKYTPASLNKVPIMLTYYKVAENEPSILSDRIFYAGAEDYSSVQEIKPSVTLTPGHTYSVQELIEHMIEYSDNNASRLLTTHLSDTHHVTEYGETFSDLGIDPHDLLTGDTISAQQYSLFLRSLYNATYLNREYSEMALKILSETDFPEGMRAGVPQTRAIAQKFGEVRMVDENGTLVGKQINNCGIVYYPDHPYILCVMTKGVGDNIPMLEGVISTVSKTIYEGVAARYQTTRP